MAIERRNPLPVGLYWVDVFQPDWERFNSWLAKWSAETNVVRSEQFSSNEGGPAREWVLFEVLVPDTVQWLKGLGFPTIAGDRELTSDDTVQKPPPEQPPLDGWFEGDFLGGSSAGKGSSIVPWVIVGGLGAVALAYGAKKLL